MSFGSRLSTWLLAIAAAACAASPAPRTLPPSRTLLVTREPPIEYVLIDPDDPPPEQQPAPEPEPAPEPLTPPGAANDDHSRPLPMFGAMVLQRVKNFDTWQSAFEQRRDARVDAGFVAHGIMRGVENNRLVAVWLAVTDLVQAKQFFADKALRDEMRAGGVEGKPRILLWSNVEAKMDPGRQELSAALVIIKVKDLAAFKLAFDAAASDRMNAGIVGYGLSRDVDDPSVAYVYLQSDDPDTLRAYLAAKDTRQSWKEAGLLGAPSITLVREGELTTYQ